VKFALAFFFPLRQAKRGERQVARKNAVLIKKGVENEKSDVCSNGN